MDIVYDGVVGAVAVKQIKSSGLDPSLAKFVGRASGAIAPSIISVQSLDPKVTFDMMDVGGAIAGIGDYLAVAAGTITIPYNRMANGATFAGASANFQINATAGLFTASQYSASQDGDASATIEGVLLSSDGLIAPCTTAVNNTLASQTFNGAWTLGPVLINGTALTQVTSVNVRTGISVISKRFDGYPYPTWASIVKTDPTIEITTHNLDIASSYAIIGSAMTSCAVYFRKRSDGATLVAGAGSVHPKFSFAAGLVEIGSIRASEHEPGAVTITLHGKALTQSATQALP